VPDGGRILITGIAGVLAAQLARRLAEHEAVELVIGVDEQLPVHDLGQTRILRTELASSVIADVLERERIDTLVHLALSATPEPTGARRKEHNVIGTMQLLAAAQGAPHLRSVVLKSSTAVYGSDATNQALFGEDVATEAAGGYAKDIIEAEGFARALVRRRDGVVLTVLRFANLLGSGIESAFAGYLSLPVLPTVLGYDPRIQLCHTADAVEVLLQSCLDNHPGIFNVAGDGVMYLSQVARVAGRPTLPIPLPLVGGLAGVLRKASRLDLPADQLRYLSYGRVADITRLRKDFGYEPRYTTRATLEAFLTEQQITPLVDQATWRRLEQRALTLARDMSAQQHR
jgi:UDP-glucose 4-epimerase